MSDEIQRLLAAINEHPDSLHGDRTPAVDGLISHGLAALPYVLPLLEEEDGLTRLRAQRVLEGVTHAWVAERVATRQLTRAGAQEWQRLWRENGGYDWQHPPRARKEAVSLWRAWLEDRRR